MKNILVLLLLVLPECIWAQSYSVKKLGAMEGLSNNNVLSIAQDKQGYLWFATEEGLNKFDGYILSPIIRIFLINYILQAMN